MSAFKSARYFDPAKASELKPSCNDIDNLKQLSFFDNGVKSRLKSELPQYLAAAEDVNRHFIIKQEKGIVFGRVGFVWPVQRKSLKAILYRTVPYHTTQEVGVGYGQKCH